MKPSLILATATLALFGCSRHPEVAATRPSLPAARVRLAPVTLSEVAQTTELTGLVRPTQHAILSAKVMGVIADMPVALGQAVHAGDLLVKVSADEIAARVTQARSQFNAARRDLERERELAKKGASTADMVRGLEDRVSTAEAMVREAETMQSYTELRAPFDGTISRKLANTGDMAAPGYPLLELEGASGFQVEASVPDSLAASLSPGAVLDIEIPATHVRFSAQLTELSSAADPMALTVLAKFVVPTGVHVRSGQFARLQILEAALPTLLVPATAVSRVGQLQRVFVLGEGDRAVLRLVKTGAAHGASVEILAGLDDKERIVVDGSVAIREGQPLEIVP